MCLPYKYIAEKCLVSAQCLQTFDPKIACYSGHIKLVNITLVNDGNHVYELKGICLCPYGYYLRALKECIPRRYLQESCSDSHQCVIKNSYCHPETKRCTCRLPFKKSSRDRCILALPSEACSDDYQCMQYDTNTECSRGKCRCLSNRILNSSGNCVLIPIKRQEPDQFQIMIFLVVLILILILASVHDKLKKVKLDYEPAVNKKMNGCTMNINENQRESGINTGSYPMSLSGLTLAMILPIRQQTNCANNHIVVDKELPTYEQVMAELRI